jgi:peptidoglycan-N-acetylglucosamine deacetylase
LIGRKVAAFLSILLLCCYKTIPAEASSILQPTDDEKIFYYNQYLGRGVNYSKGVFLTFDDGPSKNTIEILDILQKNNIKASFFVIGMKAEKNPEIVKRMKESGMCILPHTYTHNYKKIYKSPEAYFNDLESCCRVIKELTRNNPFPYVRFPGGSHNSIGKRKSMSSIKRILKERNMKYIDWNVSSEDAKTAVVSMSHIRKNVIEQCSYRNFSVVLMHDAPTKKTTVDALPDIIKYLKENNYTFRTFRDITDAEERELVKRGIINK